MIESEGITHNSHLSCGHVASNGIFLLIDAVQYPGIWRILQFRFRRLPWISLASTAGQTELSPVLIHVTADQTRTLAWFLEHTQGMHCLSWIVSSADLLSLRDHLRSLSRIEAVDGSRYIMRFYDTRILPAWYQMLSYEQELHALGPMISWAYMDREGMPCTLFGHAKPVVPPSYTMRLTPVQEQQLLDAALPDIVLERLEQNGNADLLAMQKSQRYAFVADQVNKAKQQYGIHATQEIVLFCSLALGIGRNFDKLLPVAQVLQKFADSHSVNKYRSMQNA